MARRRPGRMETNEFLGWMAEQDARYELINGLIVSISDPTARHNHAVGNALSGISDSLRERYDECVIFSSDIAVVIPDGNIRYADLGVDCDGLEEGGPFVSGNPKWVMEVVPNSADAFDLVRKLEDYRSVSSLMHIVLVDLDQPEVLHWQRKSASDWSFEVIKGLDSVIGLPDLGITLPLATLYAGLEFKAQPRLVYPE